MSASSRVTLTDIAEQLGLTKVSVSKALRDHPDISTETKETVKRKAEEMGYVRNRLAQSLTRNKTNTLGVVVPKISHTFFSDVLDGINKVASENGYDIILCVSEESAELEKRHLNTLLSMQVDGLLVSVSEETTDGAPFRAVLDQNVPLVFFDRGMEAVDATQVTVDDEGGAYKAVRHALRNGRGHVAHLAGYSHVTIGRNRRRGYERALRDHGIDVRSALIVEGGFGEHDGYVGGRRLLRTADRVDAIFTVTFPVALGLEDAIRESESHDREDIEVYSFGQHGLNRFFEHPHISVRQPAGALGKRATSILLKEMEDSGAEPTTIEISTSLVEKSDLGRS